MPSWLTSLYTVPLLLEIYKDQGPITAKESFDIKKNHCSILLDKSLPIFILAGLRIMIFLLQPLDFYYIYFLINMGFKICMT